jgi:hypothetical protein
MEHLTDEQLQNTLNKLREELTRKMSNEKTTSKNSLPSLYIDLENINNRMNEVTAEGKKRGVNLI